jgi:hypothetical protein
MARGRLTDDVGRTGRERLLTDSETISSDHVELDSIQDRVVTDRPRMRRPFAQRLSIGFARSTHINVTDRVEREQIDRVDLDVNVANWIDATDSHFWPLPQAKRDGDGACDYLVTNVSTELHRTPTDLLS